MEAIDVILSVGSPFASAALAALLLEKRVALRRAVAEHTAHERVAAIKKIGELVSRAVREANEVERETEKRARAARELPPPSVDNLMYRWGLASSPPMLASLELVGSAATVDAVPFGASTALAELAATAEAASRRHATLEALAELARKPPKPTAPPQRQGWPFVSPPDATPDPFEDMEFLEDFVYSGTLTAPQEELMAALREALDGALLFLSPENLGEFEALMPKVVRGSPNAASKARRVLVEARIDAHRDHDGSLFTQLWRGDRCRKEHRA